MTGFLTAAAGCAALLYAVSALTSGDYALSNFLFLLVGLLFLLTFVGIEWFKARRGQEPLLDLRRFKDHTFAWSGLALVFFSMVLFGLLFLLPLYLWKREAFPRMVMDVSTSQDNMHGSEYFTCLWQRWAAPAVCRCSQDGQPIEISKALRREGEVGRILLAARAA